MSPQREYAIECGVNNAIETVIVDKAMPATEAYDMLNSFVSDGLNCHGINDCATDADMSFARRLWPFTMGGQLLH